MNTLDGPGEPERIARTLDLVSSRITVKGLRVLDLACRIGSFASAFHTAGATVTAIEGRQANLDHAPSGPTYLLGDVRDLPELGTFDVTLCLGILYHLTANEAIRLLGKMRHLTQGFAIVDTHVGAEQSLALVEGIGYPGSPNPESPAHPWSGLSATPSWWFTDFGLEQAIAVAGWQTIEHVPGKGWEGEREDRRWLVIS